MFAATPICLLYTSDAADERSSVDLGGRSIIKKKKYATTKCCERHIIEWQMQRYKVTQSSKMYDSKKQ